jgi:hypothetical protein
MIGAITADHSALDLALIIGAVMFFIAGLAFIARQPRPITDFAIGTFLVAWGLCAVAVGLLFV